MAHLPLNPEDNNLRKPLTPQEAGLLGGRPKGVPNKFTRDIKEMIVGALNDAGGRDYLHKQAIANPTAFMGLVGKVLPTTLVGDPKRPIVVSVTEEERRREVDAVIDAVFGYNNVITEGPVITDAVITPVEHEAVASPSGCMVAEAASASPELQAVEDAEPDDKVVQLSHTKSHSAG